MFWLAMRTLIDSITINITKTLGTEIFVELSTECERKL